MRRGRQVCKGTLKVKKTGAKLPVAIKVAKLDSLTKEQIKEIMREVSTRRVRRFMRRGHRRDSCATWTTRTLCACTVSRRSRSH